MFTITCSYKKFFVRTHLGISCRLKRNLMEEARGRSMEDQVKRCIPLLDGESHKGQAGRIGIIGGSLEYTGAPYFAGISAFKVGADLVHIFCATSAAAVIKSYSPELIVHPLLDTANAVDSICPWLDRLHAIVIGPGLGREPTTLNTVSQLLQVIRVNRIPLVIDADGLFIITERPEIIKEFQSPVILTPNKIEFQRLVNKLGGVSELKQLGNLVTVLKKGQKDEVYNSLGTTSEPAWVLESGGSGRRCGGQGDILAGSIATFLNWTLNGLDKLDTRCPETERSLLASSLSCHAACRLVRCCNQNAFKVKGRSMLATDMIDHIHDSFEQLFGQ